VIGQDRMVMQRNYAVTFGLQRATPWGLGQKLKVRWKKLIRLACPISNTDLAMCCFMLFIHT